MVELHRCPTCGGMVQMPCLLCSITGVPNITSQSAGERPKVCVKCGGPLSDRDIGAREDMELVSYRTCEKCRDSQRRADTCVTYSDRGYTIIK
jgi:hypothetical protein